MLGEDRDHGLVDAAVARKGQRTPAPQRGRAQSQRGVGDELAAARIRISRRLAPSHGVIPCSSLNLRAKYVNSSAVVCACSFRLAPAPWPPSITS